MTGILLVHDYVNNARTSEICGALEELPAAATEEDLEETFADPDSCSLAIGDFADLNQKLDFDLSKEQFTAYCEGHNDGSFVSGLQVELGADDKIYALWAEE
jgi:hypothetical protein